MIQHMQEVVANSMIQNAVAIIVGVVIIWAIIKTLQRVLFSKIKDNEHLYRAKKVSAVV